MGLITLDSWATSRNGNPISLSHSQDVQLNAPCSPIVIIGGVHGDEPEGVALTTGLIGWLSQVLTSPTPSPLKPWVLIPCLNPDGFAARSRVNGAGVDLNRNYPSSGWSPIAKSERYFPGASPGSEPEIKCLVELIQATRPRLLIHCHSWEPCIVLTGHPGVPEARRLAEVSGYRLTETIGYDTPGSLSEFGWKDSSIPVICIEEQEGCALDQVWPRFAPAFSDILFGTCEAHPGDER